MKRMLLALAASLTFLLPQLVNAQAPDMQWKVYGERANFASVEPPTAPIFRIELGAHTQGIDGIATDSLGRWVATASTDKTVRLYEVTTGKLIRTFRPPMNQENDGNLYSIALSPDGSTVAVGGWTGIDWDKSNSIYLFDTASGSLTRRISGMPDTIIALAISSDGATLAAGLQGENGIRLFRMSDGAEIGRDTAYGGKTSSVHFAADGRLVSSCADGNVRLYAPLSLAAGTSPLRLAVKKRTSAAYTPFEARFSPEGDKVAVGYIGGAHLDILNGTDLEKLHHAGGMVELPEGQIPHYVGWSADGNTLYSQGGRLSSDGTPFSTTYLWKDGGKGRINEIPFLWSNKESKESINKILALPSGGLLIGTKQSSLAILDQKGEFRQLVTSQQADFWPMVLKQGELLLSEDGSEVAFEFDNTGKPYRFDLSGRSLSQRGNNIEGRQLYKSIRVNPWKDGKGISSTVFRPGFKTTCFAYNTDGFVMGSFHGTNGDMQFMGVDASTGKTWLHYVDGFPGACGCNISRDGRVATAALNDGTIRWYRMSDGKELLAFFPHADKKRWVIWTPEGFFDHSPGGDELIGYHLNRGKDKEAEFIPVSKLYNIYYRPDLVNAAFEGKDIAEYAKGIDINKLLAGDTLPPKVRLLTQSGKATVHDTVIKAELCDNGGGIGDITLYLNGMPVTVSKAGRGVKLVQKASAACSQFEHTITLADGDNEISLMAYNKAMTIESNRDSIKLSYASGNKTKPDLHLLTVAVNSYRDGDLRLSYSVPDAKAIAESFKGTGGNLFGQVVVHQLLDAEVTRNGMERAFAEIGKRTSRDDVFVLFVAGHGITGTKDGAYYFLPYDFRYTGEDAVARQGVSMDDFKGYLANVNALKSLILLDTCNSGSFSEAIASRGMVEKTAINKLVRAVGRATIVASSKSQVALEGYEGHGAFTWTVLDGLKGKAADGSGRITINGLATHVEELLPQITFKKWGFEQVPQKSLQGMDFPIGVK